MITCLNCERRGNCKVKEEDCLSNLVNEIVLEAKKDKATKTAAGLADYYAYKNSSNAAKIGKSKVRRR